MIQQTSLEAYKEIKADLGSKQMEILRLFQEYHHLTDQMISKLISKPINCVTPRRNELVKMGLIVKVSTIISDFTQRRVILWGLK